jgi:hypothetical protein
MQGSPNLKQTSVVVVVVVVAVVVVNVVAVVEVVVVDNVVVEVVSSGCHSGPYAPPSVQTPHENKHWFLKSSMKHCPVSVIVWHW